LGQRRKRKVGPRGRSRRERTVQKGIKKAAARGVRSHDLTEGDGKPVEEKCQHREFAFRAVPQKSLRNVAIVNCRRKKIAKITP